MSHREIAIPIDELKNFFKTWHKPVKIKIKYLVEGLESIEKINVGDMIDLRAARDVFIAKGQNKLIPLGVAMQLPEGYEAHLYPRSSTFKKFKILMTNHVGIIDNSYSGDNDEWMFSAYAVEDTWIHKNDRICQFRIVENQPKIEFEVVDHLSDENRGGFGSTGIN